jgi:hypothetical protein
MSATLKAPHNLSDSIPSQGMVQRFSAALRAAYAGRHAVKVVARDADADARTAESWINGRTAPRFPELVELMAANDQLEKQIYALVREIRERRTCRNQN